MPKPVLSHNRYEFQRLNDLQNDVLVGGGGVCAVVLAILLFVFYPATWIVWVWTPAFIVIAAVAGVLEIRKALVVVRDAEERNEQRNVR
jgi:hypothetical protein